MEVIELSKYLEKVFETPSNEYSEWFGYYTYDTLTTDHSKLLCNRIKVDGIRPRADLNIEIGYYDIQTGEWHHVGNSDSWNWQQGCMAQWLNDKEIIYNSSENNHHISIIHNIELRPGQGAKLVRSAGAFAQLTSKEGNYAIIKMPSGETRKILAACKATIGSVGNSDHGLEKSGKAGRSRLLGRRPHNRGVVMNPVDHPMGGGEGRASGGHPRSRKGLYAKGLKTRAPKKHSSKYIIERRKK